MREEVTAIVPVGPRHANIVDRATASVRAQTVPVALEVVHDRHARGPSWARNQGIARAETLYLAFLDADDEWLPAFVERCLEAIQGDWGRYAYTDWFDETGQVVQSADPAWCGDGGWHPVATVVPAHWVRHIGGFDEKRTQGGEDTEFFWRLTHAGCCGTRVDEPLFIYHTLPDRRSLRWRHTPDYNAFQAEMRQRYGGAMSGCCGNRSGRPMATESNHRQPGDVLAIATWGGRRSQVGAATGRVYQKVGNYRPAWIDPRDVQAMPRLFRKVATPPPPPPPPAEPVAVRRRARRPYTFHEVARLTRGGTVVPVVKHNTAQATPAAPPLALDTIIDKVRARQNPETPATAVMTIVAMRAWLKGHPDHDAIRAALAQERARAKPRRTALKMLEHALR